MLADEAVDSLTNAALNETLFPLTDHLGSVRDLVDDAGTLRKHTAFDSFGRMTEEAFFDSSGNSISQAHAEAINQLFGYTGKLLDEATGLQNNLNRWYDADTGRWLSQDPIGFEAGDPNFYRYASNQPTTFVDYNGLENSEYRYLPQPDRGYWTGKPGDSRFVFNEPELPIILYKGGQPDLSAYVYKQGDRCGTVTIDLDGDLSKGIRQRRDADIDAANKAMQEKYPGWQRPAEYVWHHQYVNRRTGRGQMALIEERTHRAASHEGAFSFWTKYLEAK